jgi:hypothetical protein
LRHKAFVNASFTTVGERRPAQQVDITKNSFPVSRAVVLQTAAKTAQSVETSPHFSEKWGNVSPFFRKVGKRFPIFQKSGETFPHFSEKWGNVSTLFNLRPSSNVTFVFLSVQAKCHVIHHHHHHHNHMSVSDAHHGRKVLAFCFQNTKHNGHLLSICDEEVKELSLEQSWLQPNGGECFPNSHFAQNWETFPNFSARTCEFVQNSATVSPQKISQE